jgi:hypothetical protein
VTAPEQPAPVSPDLECTVCASGVTSPHGAGAATPEQPAYGPVAVTNAMLAADLRARRLTVLDDAGEPVDPDIIAAEIIGRFAEDGPQEPHAADGKTGGQLAYEAYAKAIPEDLFPQPLRGMEWTPWEKLPDAEKRAYEAAAAAVETEQVRLARADRDAVRGRMLALAAQLETAAAHTLSREAAEAKRAAAQQIRKGLDL